MELLNSVTNRLMFCVKLNSKINLKLSLIEFKENKYLKKI